jgi:hypothetical protein
MTWLENQEQSHIGPWNKLFANISEFISRYPEKSVIDRDEIHDETMRKYFRIAYLF